MNSNFIETGAILLIREDVKIHNCWLQSKYCSSQQLCITCLYKLAAAGCLKWVRQPINFDVSPKSLSLQIHDYHDLMFYQNQNLNQCAEPSAHTNIRVGNAILKQQVLGVRVLETNVWTRYLIRMLPTNMLCCIHTIHSEWNMIFNNMIMNWTLELKNKP